MTSGCHTVIAIAQLSEQTSELATDPRIMVAPPPHSPATLPLREGGGTPQGPLKLINSVKGKVPNCRMSHRTLPPILGQIAKQQLPQTIIIADNNPIHTGHALLADTGATVDSHVLCAAAAAAAAAAATP